MPIIRRLVSILSDMPSSARFGSLDTSLGRLYVGVTDFGVCAVIFKESLEQEQLEFLVDDSSNERPDDSMLSEVIKQIGAYFAGNLQAFSVSVDLSAVTPFTARVLEETRKLKFGQLTSYGQLANCLGGPRFSRAVGGALGRNPIPILIPCHRVIARNGGIGGFTGGLKLKQALLGLEGHSLSGHVPKLFSGCLDDRKVQ
ncbi:MAG: hypothetical protein CL484_07990 [Acidobacteria bacterium]|nr:hypothetical protein [Acidobacteriota bacterium]